jgi:trehalose 6-phosphate phosphatase
LTAEALKRQRFLEHLFQAPEAVLALDYDGTLAPFTLQRDRAFPYPGVARLLQEIMTAGATRVVMVTGRPAAEVLCLLGVRPYPEVWGLHGLQRLKPSGSSELVAADPESRHTLAEAREWLESIELRHLGEVKPGSIAFHWRGMSDEEATQLRNKVLLRWMPLSFRPKMTLLQFDGGFELRLAARSKADALRTILAETTDDAAIAYLGDDQSDEEAFTALRPRGLTVLARPQWRPTTADLWITPPKGLLEFLSQWLEIRRTRRAEAASAD